MRLLFSGRKFDGVAGGVERMIVLLMNAMCDRGHEVTLLTWDKMGAKTYYPLDSRVRWHPLDMGDAMVKAGWMMRLKRMWKIRKLIKTDSPDVVIAFQNGPFVTIALSILGLGIPIVAAVRNAPTRFEHTSSGKYRELIFNSYRLAARITVQMDNYRDFYPNYLKNRIRHIPNPVVKSEALASPAGNPSSSERILLNLGRLSYQKNQATLLKSFARIAADFPCWRLRLVGEGEERGRLEGLCRQLELEGRVDFAGAKSDIGGEYSAAHLFCFPSLWEGFPNALAEAMAHGLPVIGYKACAGTNELIQHNINGLLVEGHFGEEPLCEALAELMRSDLQRETMGKRAQEVVDQYTPDMVFSSWELLFEEVVA